MADWLLMARAVALLSLPCLLLIYTVLVGTAPPPRAPPLTPLQWPPRLPHPQRAVLVTGAAGFIGFHVARELVSQWGPSAVVVGVDVFSDYYDVQLKRDRASELVRRGVKLYQADVCNRPFLSHLFAKYNFTDVVHMAAQAGVRHSLKDPTAYVRANVQCFLALLDTLKESKHTSLVYASSSSVYGRDASLPFTPHSPPHPPGNLYAALKISNEHFAQAYCSQHRVQAVGLRLFTVYGPWGRPDMAVYKFAESILRGKPVPVFDPGPAHSLMRDFTYINDTVAGVLAALDHAPLQCGEVYNVGSGHPSPLHTMLEGLEQELNTTTTTELLPLPPSDLYSTFADISETWQRLHYNPRTPLQEGLRHFVSWLRAYHSERDEWESNGRGSNRNRILQVALAAGEEEWRWVQWRHLGEVNRGYRDRISTLRNSYTGYAQEHGIPLPKLQKRRFIFYPGVDSPGSTVIKAPGYQGNLELLQDRCLRTEQCVAFTERGEFKNHLRSRDTWTNSSDGKGLYVADVDMCASDLHDCGPHSHCHPTGPGTHTCLCHDGYIKLGRICVERYVEGVVGKTEAEWRLSDELEGVEWEEEVEGREFVFFQGLDSPGGDYLVVDGERRDVGRLREACEHTHRCIAFNTNGVLKHSLRPPHQWVQWTSQSHHGLYVRDVDYCSLDIEQCPAHSHCVQHAPGNYSCACEPSWVMEQGYQCVREEVEVIVSVDREHLPGLVTVVSSVQRHSSLPVRFHVVVAGEEGGRREVEEWLHCHGMDRNVELDVVEAGAGELERLVRVYSRPEDVGNLASPANYARFQFHTLFPKLSRALYLDADTVVLGDIAHVWRRLAESRELLVAVPRSSPSYGGVFSERVRQFFQQRYGHSFNSGDPTFNAGVYGVNFDLWRQRDTHTEVLYWMEQQAKEPLWGFGTQPIMLLVAYGQWEHLEPQWNVNGLGWNKDMSRESLEGANLLHWNGRRKPWLPDGLYSELWLPHFPSACSGRGRCTHRPGGGYQCQCGERYTGENCQEVVR